MQLRKHAGGVARTNAEINKENKWNFNIECRVVSGFVESMILQKWYQYAQILRT